MLPDNIKNNLTLLHQLHVLPCNPDEQVVMDKNGSVMSITALKNYNKDLRRIKQSQLTQPESECKKKLQDYLIRDIQLDPHLIQRDALVKQDVQEHLTGMITRYLIQEGVRADQAKQVLEDLLSSQKTPERLPEKVALLLASAKPDASRVARGDVSSPGNSSGSSNNTRKEARQHYPLPVDSKTGSAIHSSPAIKVYNWLANQYPEIAQHPSIFEVIEDYIASPENQRLGIEEQTCQILEKLKVPLQPFDKPLPSEWNPHYPPGADPTKLTLEEHKELAGVYKEVMELRKTDVDDRQSACQSFANSLECFFRDMPREPVISVNTQVQPVPQDSLIDMGIEPAQAFATLNMVPTDGGPVAGVSPKAQEDPNTSTRFDTPGQFYTAMTNQTLTGSRYTIVKQPLTGNAGHFALMKKLPSGRFAMVDGQGPCLFPVLNPDNQPTTEADSYFGKKDSPLRITLFKIEDIENNEFEKILKESKRILLYAKNHERR